MKNLTGSIVVLIATVSFASAAVNVDVSTPNARVQVGTPQAPPPQVRVIERETVVVREGEHHDRHDNGKHKGQHKKQKKHKKDKKHHD